MNQKEYHNAEMSRFARECAQVDAQPLRDRQDARADVAEMLATPEWLARSLGFLFEGAYGYAQQYRAREIAVNKRCNRAANLVTLLGYLECRCPANFTVQAYKRLSDETRATVDKFFADFLENYSPDADE